MQSINNQEAIDFFLKHQKQYHLQDINSCSLYYDGYSNISYLIELKNHHQYLVKLSKHVLNDTVNETEIYQKYFSSALIYSDKQKNYILKWFNHQNLNIKNSLDLNLMNKIFAEIDHFHHLNLKQQAIKDFDYFCDQDILKTKKQMYLLYCSILQKYEFNNKQLSHGDVNFKNILYLEPSYKIKLIDYEWVRNNYLWFDYINLIAEDCICNRELFDLFRKYTKRNWSEKEIYELIFIKWFFSWAWAKKYNHLKIMKQYQKKAWKQTKNYFKYFKKLENN